MRRSSATKPAVPVATALSATRRIAVSDGNGTPGSGRWCRHRETDDTRGHKGTPHTIQQTNHCTPLSSALGQRLQARHAVALQCGVRLLVCTSRTEANSHHASVEDGCAGKPCCPPVYEHIVCGILRCGQESCAQPCWTRLSGSPRTHPFPHVFRPLARPPTLTTAPLPPPCRWNIRSSFVGSAPKCRRSARTSRTTST